MAELDRFRACRRAHLAVSHREQRVPRPAERPAAARAPMDMGPVGRADAPVHPPVSESLWIGPIPDGRVVPTGDPAEEAEARESVRLALITALQTCRASTSGADPARGAQVEGERSGGAARHHSGVGEQRPAASRSTLADRNITADAAPGRSTRNSATCWLAMSTRSSGSTSSRSSRSCTRTRRCRCRRTRYGSKVRASRRSGYTDRVPSAVGRGSCPSRRTARRRSHSRAGDGDGFRAWVIHVLRISDGRIATIDYFVDPDLFPLFDLPIDRHDFSDA